MELEIDCISLLLKGYRETVAGHEAKKSDTSVDNELKYIFTAISHSKGSEQSRDTTVTYNPPDVITYDAKFPGVCIQTRATPVSSTSCIVFFNFVGHKNGSWLSSLIRVVFRSWIFHLVENIVFDGDLAFLKGQARCLRQREQEGKGWDSQYFMPVSCDAAVVGFRRYDS